MPAFRHSLGTGLAHADAVAETAAGERGARDEAGGISCPVGNETGTLQAAEKLADVEFLHDRLRSAFSDESQAIHATRNATRDVGDGFDPADPEAVHD